MKILLMMLLLAIAPGALAGTPWFYGGDFDGRGFLESARNTAIEDARVYDNFLNDIPGLEIDWVFGNFLVDGPLPTEVYYEIRQNMGPGNGGELLASGTGAATVEITAPHRPSGPRDCHQRTSERIGEDQTPGRS
ncbi:MAG: hypothetical protein ACR2HJ_04365 [Fimbriimonadales bacterium]